MGDIYQWTFESDATRLANKLEGYVEQDEIKFFHYTLISYGFNFKVSIPGSA